MSERIWIIGGGTPTDAEFQRMKLLVEVGFELVRVGPTDVEIEGQTMELAVWDEVSSCVRETEKDNRPYYRKFEKRGKW